MSAETLHARTADGWDLAIHHWEPVEDVPRARCPVVLIHGMGANRLNLDLDDRYSLARALRRRGFAAYVLELRGVGYSRPPEGEHSGEWGFLDYLQTDLPAAVRTILDHAGAEALHGIGHSMGGMLLYAYGSKRPPQLRSITAIGSPYIRELELAPRERHLLRLATRIATQERLPGGRVPLKGVMGAAGRLVPITARIVNGLLLNSSNTEREVMSRMAREAIDDIPIKLVWELTMQMAGRENAAYAYEDALDNIEVPVFAVGGSGDRVAPPSSVRAAVDRISSRDVRYREMGQRYGDRADYGHIDLLVGRDAPEEVFPIVLDFLEEADRAQA